MLGQINEWFFHDLLGIAAEPAGAGFTQIIIKPIVVGDIDWVKGSYQSVSGPIAVNWKLNKDVFSLDVTIPPNTTALVYLPNVQGNAITESGKIITKAANIKFVKTESDKAVYEVGSGNYHFSSKIK
jgi:alpha-L-rhamnosidase